MAPPDEVLPRSCRAVVLESYDTPPQVREVPLTPPRTGELLVRLQAASACGTDVHIADGRFPAVSSLPLVLGHEGCGRIVQLGGSRSVDVLGQPLSEGDLVVWDYPWCGSCPACAIHRQPTLCSRTNGYGWGPWDGRRLNGTFADYLHIAERSNVLRVGAELSAGLLSSATCALRTVMHAYERLGPISFDDVVVVLGAGAVGLYATAAAVAAGAYRVVLVGAPAARLALTDTWGLAGALDIETTTAHERRDQVLELTGGRGADIVIECAGPAPAFTEGLDLLRRGGRFMVIGQASAEKPPVDTTQLKARQTTLLTSLSATIAHYRRAVCFLETHARRFGLDRLVAGTPYGLHEIDRALDDLRRQVVVKPVFTIDPISHQQRGSHANDGA